MWIQVTKENYDIIKPGTIIRYSNGNTYIVTKVYKGKRQQNCLDLITLYCVYDVATGKYVYEYPMSGSEYHFMMLE